MTQSRAWRASSQVVLLLAAMVLAGCGKSEADLMADAKAAMAKNDRAAATIILKGAIQANDKLPEARFLLGKVLQEGGAPAQAEIELRRALELGHPESQVVPVLAHSLLQMNQAARVTSAYGQTEWPDAQATADLKVSVATAWMMQKSTAQAAAAVAAALRLSPNYEPALIMQARQTAVAGDLAGALAQVDALLARDPKSGDGWAFKGELMMGLAKDRPGAIAAYQKAVEVKPTAMAAHAALISLYLSDQKVDAATKQLEQMKAAGPHNLQTTMLDGQVALAKSDFKRAREQFQLVLRALPNHVPSLQSAAMAELGLNSLAQAELYLSKAMALAPEAIAPRALLAQTQMRQGHYDKALVTLAPLLERPNPPVQMILAAAQANLGAGETAKAEALFQRAAKAAPDDPKIRTALALGRLSKGSPDAVVSELQAISASDSGVSADLAIIATELRLGKTDDARKAIDNLGRKQPDKPVADLLRGQLLVRDKDLAGARKSFEASAAKDPKYYPAVAALSGLDMLDKKPELAKARFTEFLKTSPGHLQATMALAEVAQRSGGSHEEVLAQVEAAIKANPSDARPRVALIDLQMAYNNPKAALSTAQAAATALPESLEVQDRLGRVNLVSGDKQQALAAYNRMVALQPKSPRGYMGLADVAQTMGDTAGAARQVRKALELAPESPQLQRAAIESALADKHPEQATAVARQVQLKHPTDAIGYSYEGDIAFQQKQLPQAEAAYRKALGKPGGDTAATRIHIVLRAAGKTAEADQWSASWRKDHPKDALFLYHLGDDALAQNDSKGAEQWYTAVLAIQPNNALALNNVAYLMAQQKRAGAVAMAEKAVLAGPNQPQFLDTLALAQAAEGQLPKAIETEKKALAMVPKDNSIRLSLARLYVEAGDKANAKTELDTLAALGSAYPNQAEVSRLLKSVSGG